MHDLHDLRVRRLWVVNQQSRRIDNLGGIMRRNAGRHPDRDPARAVRQQVRKQPRHDLGLFVFAVICRAEIGAILIKPVHQLDGGLGQPSFGIPVRRRVIAVDIAKIPLPVDQRITQGKSLREADHCIINRLVAMRVIFADDIADNTRAFFIALRWVEL